MKILHPFQTTLETIRAHHWRYYADLYIGCHFDCLYCLYRGNTSYSTNVTAKANAPELILAELKTLPKGILDIGAVSDVYQPIEGRCKYMRRLLKGLLQMKQPTFIGTKSTLVTRDIDLLKKMAIEGLIEVSFTVISLNAAVTELLEPNAPSPCERLDAAKTLSNHGIPVSFHLAPVIPGMLAESELRYLIHKLKDTGGKHIFSCILGGRKTYWDRLVVTLSSLLPDNFHDWDVFKSVYLSKEEFDDRRRAQSANYAYLTDIMESIRKCCEQVDIEFICENIPAFTNIDLVDGIYRWKLPTIYDMTKYISRSAEPVGFDQFYLDYWCAFSPPNDLYEFVSHLWETQVLFTNTWLSASIHKGSVHYSPKDNLSVNWGGVMTVTKKNSF